MLSKLPVLALAAGALLANEGTRPRASAADYPIRGQAGSISVGVEYNVRTVTFEARSTVLPDHLSVEVAIFPPDPLGAEVSARQFSLRINGSKTEVFADSAGAVAASLKYPGWSRERSIVAVAGPVIIAPPTAPRFPGDNRGAHPLPPIERDTVQEDAPWVAEVALREGHATGPVSGYVYFPYKGKIRKLRTVELLYRPHPDSDPVILRLR